MKSLTQTLNNDAIRYNVGGGVFSCYLGGHYLESILVSH